MTTSSTRLILPLAFAAVVGTASASTVLNYPDFSDVTGLQLNGSAAQAGNALRVTPALTGQGGSVFSTTAVTLNSQVSFSTFFSFKITNHGNFGDGDGAGADGLVFVVQTNANNVGGGGGGIGYQGILNSVGIEYDTYDNGMGLGDPDGNHVAIDINGDLSNPLAPAVPVGTRLNDDSIWYSWVDYNGVTDELEVRLSLSNSRPAAATSSTMVDLTSVLGSPNAFVGFTSGTGSGVGNHDILSWEFRDDYSPVDPGPSVPDSGGTLAMMGLGLSALGICRRILRK